MQEIEEVGRNGDLRIKLPCELWTATSASERTAFLRVSTSALAAGSSKLRSAARGAAAASALV